MATVVGRRGGLKLVLVLFGGLVFCSLSVWGWWIDRSRMDLSLFGEMDGGLGI